MKIQNVGDPLNAVDYAIETGGVLDLGEVEARLKEKAQDLNEELPEGRREKRRLQGFSAQRETACLFNDYPARFRPADKEAEAVWNEAHKKLPDAYRRLAKGALKKSVQAEEE